MTLMHIQRRRLLVPVPFCLVVRRIDCGSFAKSTHHGGSSATFKCDNVVSEGVRTLRDLGVTPTSVDTVLPSYLDRYRPGGLFT